MLMLEKVRRKAAAVCKQFENQFAGTKVDPIEINGPTAASQPY